MLFQNEYIQIILRSVAVYVFIILAIRLFGKKELAQLSIIDLVFILLISNSVQNAMVGSNTSLQGGLVAAFSLFILNFALKKLSYKNTRFNELLEGKAVMLIYKGQINDEHLRITGITTNELLAAVREHGVEKIEDVDLAMLEVDGNISVISDSFSKRSVQDSAHKRKHKLKGKIN
ncbi:MAG: YetF domain-containing protein [Chitinophagaceae bacterium]